MTRLAFLLAAAVAAPLISAHADEDEYLPPVADVTVRQECGACHMVFPPQLLPARSWQKLMADLSSHFGEDATLADPAREAITAYLVANAADGPGARGGQRFLRGLSAADTPLQISTTPFWQRAHDEITAADLPIPPSNLPPTVSPVTRPPTAAISPSRNKEASHAILIGNRCVARGHSIAAAATTA